MNKLKEYKLNELYNMSSGISSSKDQAGSGYPFVSFRDIFNNTILPENLTELMNTSEKERIKYSVKKGDVFITRTSETPDELAMSSVALKDYPNATFSGFAKRLRAINDKIVYDRYMAFYFRSKYFRKIINANTIMTLRASFNEEMFSYIKIQLPDYDTQVKIGDMLYKIEEKILINNQINNNLEELMKTLYQRWFIEFEFPNEDGKPYKSSGGKFIYSEELKQNIPTNWEIKKLTDISNFISGFAFSSNNYTKNGQYKLYTIKNVQDGYIVSIVDNTLNKLPINMPHECLLKPKDLIMSLTGNVGRVGLVYENNALLNQRVLKIVPQKNLCYLYSMYRNDFMKSRCEKISSGTSQKNLSPIELGKQKISYSEIIVEKFEEHNKYLIDTYVNNLIENQKLTELKEFLLPMLMNGQINVDNIKI